MSMALPAASATRVAARHLVARDFFEVGDLILYGKYKNKRGRIKSFGKDEKGNPTATIEPVPKGRKKDKVIQLFRFWHANPELRMKHARYSREVLVAGFTMALEKYKEVIAAGRDLPRGYKNRPGNYIDVFMAFQEILRKGKQWAEFVVDNLAFPRGKAKAVEMAVRSLGVRREPRDLIGWYDKNIRRLDLLAAAKDWPLRSEADDDVDRTFTVGPFTVYNTVHASGKALERAKRIIEVAVRHAGRTGLPGFPRMARGDLYLVGQIERKGWAAWYMGGKDVIYLRPSIRGVSEQEGAHHLLHELGHRYWRNELGRAQKSAWLTHHRRMVANKPSGRIPEVGEVLPETLLVNNKRVKVVEYTPDLKAVLADVKTGKTLGSVPRQRLWEWMAEQAHIGKFPSIYSSKDAEEHFCEALAYKAFGSLDADNLAAFDEIMLGRTASAQRVACAWLEAACS